MKYKCIKSFTVPETNQRIQKGTLFDYEEDYVSTSDVRLYLEDGDDDGGYIDITNELFDAYFKRVG